MFRQDFTCPALLEDPNRALPVRGYHPLWPDFPDGSGYAIQATGLVPVRSPLLGESRLISFPPGTEMFQFPGFASRPYGFRPGSRKSGGFPHSDIPGSKPLGGSPGLIAAYHVLHRLHAPRHPPDALLMLHRLNPYPEVTAARPQSRTTPKPGHRNRRCASSLLHRAAKPGRGITLENRAVSRERTRPSRKIDTPTTQTHRYRASPTRPQNPPSRRTADPPPRTSRGRPRISCAQKPSSHCPTKPAKHRPQRRAEALRHRRLAMNRSFQNARSLLEVFDQALKRRAAAPPPWLTPLTGAARGRALPRNRAGGPAGRLDRLVEPTGLEPVTPCLQSRCSPS